MDRTLQDAIGAIYDAAVTPSKWRHALDKTAACADAKAMALVIRDDPTGGRNKTLLSSPYLEFSKTLKGKYYGAILDRHQNADWERLSKFDPLQPISDTDGGLDPSLLDARPDYKSLRKNLGVARRVGVRLSEDRVWFDAASIGYETITRSHGVGGADLLLPHLSRAVEISRMFFKLRQAYAAVLTALDHIDVGIAICRKDGQVVVANARAQVMLAAGDGISKSRDGSLACVQSSEDDAVMAAIMAASGTAQGAGHASRATISVTRKGSDQPILVDVAPLRDSGAELDPGLTGALVVMVDPARMPDLNIARFSKAYALSTAEEDVCALLIKGHSNIEIAERRDTSPVTVKNQVASILSKTGTHGRADLMRLVLRILPPVR